MLRDVPGGWYASVDHEFDIGVSELPGIFNLLQRRRNFSLTLTQIVPELGVTENFQLSWGYG